MSDDFEDQIEEMQQPDTAPASSTLPACTLDDFCSYAPSRCCIYLPCKTMWPNASVDDRIPPVPLLKPDGSPVLNAKGKPVMTLFTQSLAKKRSVERMAWAPGMPEFIRGKLA